MQQMQRLVREEPQRHLQRASGRLGKVRRDEDMLVGGARAVSDDEGRYLHAPQQFLDGPAEYHRLARKRSLARNSRDNEICALGCGNSLYHLRRLTVLDQYRGSLDSVADIGA